jgi:hypothetical protein
MAPPMAAGPKNKRTAYRWVAAGPVVVLLAVMIWAWPYMAITQRSGGKVLVVEGWMDPPAFAEAARLALDSGYTRLYTTGTVRPFSYYLAPKEAVQAVCTEPVMGRLTVEVAGNNGGGFFLIADGDTLLDQAIGPLPLAYHAEVAHPARALRVVAWAMPMDPGEPEVFLSQLTIGGVNLNLLQEESRFIRPDGSSIPAWPTYAHSAKAALEQLGIPAASITAVPALGEPRSRSWGNAHAFGLQARMDGLTAMDVATTGVHARRSRNLFQLACGPGVKVGVVALADPWCTRGNWWKSYRGWATVLKEVIGVPEAQAVEISKWR